MVRALIFALFACALLFAPRYAKAQAKWSGNMFVEDVQITAPGSDHNLLQTGLNIDVSPPVKRKFQSRLTMRLDLAELDGDAKWKGMLSPFGNLSFDLTGGGYSLNVRQGDIVTVVPATSALQLTGTNGGTQIQPTGFDTARIQETRSSRVTFSMNLPDRPTLLVSYSSMKTITEGGGAGQNSNTRSFYLTSDYRYKWLAFRGGFVADNRQSDGLSLGGSRTILGGIAGTRGILPMTVLDFGVDATRFQNNSVGFSGTNSNSTSTRIRVSTKPKDWFELAETFAREDTKTESPRFPESRTLMQNADLTGTLIPLEHLRVVASVGNRTFNDRGDTRSVDSRTIAASFTGPLFERVLLGVDVSHTNESDPSQGTNIRDTFGVNSTMDVTPRVAGRLSLNIGRNSTPSFVDRRLFNASGTLAQRTIYDDEPAGFTFYDVEHGDLYTKNSSLPGDWSAPVHLLLNTQVYSVNMGLQMTARVTDKASLAMYYSAIAAAPELDFSRIVSQNLALTVNYIPNRRAFYSLTSSIAVPQTGGKSVSNTATMAYKFFRGHQLSLSYSRRSYLGKTSDDSSGTLRFALRKRTNLEMTYAIAQLFQTAETTYLKLRLTKAF